MAGARAIHLFEAVGIELEYMIVSRNALDVLPVCDRVIESQTGKVRGDAEFPDITWSNELALHIIELKTSEPAPMTPLQEGGGWKELATHFNSHVQRINAHLGKMGGRLMPSAMHPWMDPLTEMRLWPHDNGEIYAAFDRIFGCRGHGWANLQSMHINLPFEGDEEFGRLHAAIRLLLPILPVLAASSPYMDGKATGLLDNRLDVYRGNCAKIPSCTGRIIPEAVFTIDEYHSRILDRIDRDLAPHDPDGILQGEWVNARGAIARFVRNTIEIRVIDVQENPAADLAIAAVTVAVLKMLVNEAWSGGAAQRRFGVDPLADILDDVIRDGEQAVIRDADYLQALGLPGGGAHSAGQLWRHLVEEVRRHDPASLAPFDPQLDVLLIQGPLARRLLHAIGPEPTPGKLREVYSQLCDCLTAGRMFIG